MFKKLFLGLAVALGVSSAFAQTGSYPNNSVLLGRGPGVQGFKSAGPGTNGYCLVAKGPSLAPAFEECPGGSGGTTTPTLVTTTPYTVLQTDTTILVNVAGPATINLQSVVARGTLNLKIIDVSGAASTNNISIVPDGSDIIGGIYTNGSPLKITTDYGGWGILPIGTAWAFEPGDTSGSSNIFSLTTSGTSGAATFTGGVLNIPIYTPSDAPGTVTSVSVVSANGLAGSVANATTTPAITLSTSVNGVVKGDGTGFSAAANSDLPAMTSSVGGAVPTPPNNTTTFLRGDGTWAAPPNTGVPGGFNTQLQYNNAGVFGGIAGATTDGNVVTLTTPNLGTPTTVDLTNATNMPLSGITGFGTGVATALGVNIGSAGAPVLFDGALGTPSSGTLTNASGLPISGIAGLGSGVGTWLATPSSANLAAAVTDETGSGALVFGTNPAISGPTVTGGSIDNTPIGASTRSTGAFTTLAANGAVTLSGIPGSGSIASSICATAGGALIAQAGANCYAGGSSSAGGNNTNVQYNSSGVLAGSDNWVFNGTDTMSIGAAGSVVGKVEFFNATSGSVILQAATGALGSTVLTLPAGSTTLIGAGTTATFTNKTFDTAGTGNSFLINGLAATANTGTGAVARAVNPAFTTPNLGTPSAVVLTNATGLPVSTGVTGLGTGIAAALAINTGSAGAPVLLNGALGTPSSGTLTNVTGLPISTGISGLGTGVATFLATPSSANLAAAVTGETGTGALVFGTSPTISSPVISGGSIDNTPIGATTRSTLAATTIAANAGVTFSGLATSGTIANAVCMTAAGVLIANAGSNCYTTTGAAGSTTQVQYNSSGSLAGSAGFVYDGTSQITLGVAGASVGKVAFSNATSGSVTIQANTGALGTSVLTLPTASDTLVGKATTDTFTNKTFNTAGTGNSFQINGVAVTANTGTGAVARETSPAFTTPNLGTPSFVTLTNGTGLPISTGVSGLGTGVATFLGAPSSANLAAAVTGETGTGALVFGTSPTIATATLTSPTMTTPALGVATATSVNGLTITSTTGTLTIASGKTATYSNTLTHAGTDGTTQTFGPNSDTYLGITRIENVQSGTTDTLAQADCGYINKYTNGSAVTITIPTNASVAIGVGCQIDFYQYGAGQLTFSPSGGVTLRGLSAATKSAAQYASGFILKIGTDEWLLGGAVIP